MDILLTPDIEAALNEMARKRGVPPNDLAVEALRERFLVASAELLPTDAWEKVVLGVARDCQVSLSHVSLSSEGLYD